MTFLPQGVVEGESCGEQKFHYTPFFLSPSLFFSSFSPCSLYLCSEWKQKYLSSMIDSCGESSGKREENRDLPETQLLFIQGET